MKTRLVLVCAFAAAASAVRAADSPGPDAGPAPAEKKSEPAPAAPTAPPAKPAPAKRGARPPPHLFM